MDRFQEELDLEQRFRNNQITTKREFFEQIMQVYDLVNGSIGWEIFDGVVLPGLLRMHGSDISAAGLDALAVLAEASSNPTTQVVGFLQGWAEKKFGTIDVSPLESIASGSPEGEANLTNSDGKLPVLMYSNDFRFKKPSANWGTVYKSSAATLSHVRLVDKISHKTPSIEAIIGAQSAQILRRAYPAGYIGKFDSTLFNAKEGNDPLIIAYGLLSKVGYKHCSEEEYGFVYMVTSQGKRYPSRGNNTDMAGIPAAVTVVFAILPRKNYEEMAKKQFKGVEQFILNMLPDPYKNYLMEGGFFSKPKIIASIDAKSPYF